MKNSSSEKSKQYKNILCLDSFLETLKNCDFSFARYLNAKVLFSSPFLNNFRFSYISSTSFFENRHGFSEKDLQTNIPTLVLKNNMSFQVPLGFYHKLVSGLLNHNHFVFNIQLRGFKTDRSVRAELQRNPSFSNRIKHVFGVPNSDPLDPKQPITNVTNTEKLKQLLTNDESLNETEKQRIKIAFAEGYLVGNTGPKGGKTTRYFRVFTQVVTVFIFLAVIISLMASASGSVFR